MGESIKYAYEDGQLLTRQISPSGLVTTRSYDVEGRLLKLAAPHGLELIYSYDKSSSQVASQQPASIDYGDYIEYYRYDVMGRKIEVRQSGKTVNDRITKLTYNALGKIASTVDGLNRETIYHYDDLQRLIKVTYPSGSFYEQSWDFNNRLVEYKDSNGKTSKFFYDKNGRLISEKNNIDNKNYEYNALGQLIKANGSDGSSISCVFNNVGLLKSETKFKADDSIESESRFSYDLDGFLLGYVQVDESDILINSEDYELDYFGRTVSVKAKYGNWGASEGFELNYGVRYNADGQMDSMIYPDGSSVKFGYDSGMLHNISLPNSKNITYLDYKGMKPGVLSYPGGRGVYLYDDFGRHATSTFYSNLTQKIRELSYDYDAVDNIRTYKDDFGEASYEYDLSNRLISVGVNSELKSLGLLDKKFSYDSLGNRVHENFSGEVNVFDDAGKLLEYSNAASLSDKTQLTYYKNGQIKGINNGLAGQFFEYDVAGHMTTFSNTESDEVNYRYDPFGRRIGKKIKNASGDEIIFYVYMGRGLIAEIDKNAKINKAYGFNPSEINKGNWNAGLLWQADVSSNSLKSPTTQYTCIFSDQQNAPLIGVNDAGQVIWKLARDEFGDRKSIIESGVKINIGLPGHYFDAESGFFHNAYRDYNSKTGRYLQPDPLGLAGGENFYIYALSNPISWVDPLGLRVVNCIDQVFGPLEKSMYQEIENELTGYKIRSGIIFEPSVGPNIDPRSPRNLPLKPSVDKAFVIDKFNQWVEKTYQVIELRQQYAVMCKYIEKDKCGNDVEGVDTRFETRTDKKKDLISTREYEVFVERIFKFVWPL